jgi:hypothetical protein
MIQMIDPPLPTGQSFSHGYIQRGEPTHDSPRMRRRLAALVETFPDLSGIQVVVPQKLGVDGPIGMGGVAWRQFFVDCMLSDVLDFVTVAYRYLYGKRTTG